MQIVVLGMHRSGTSVLTQLLAAMGCHAGAPETLMAGDASSAGGFWEATDAWALDEDVLAAAGASWWDAADLDLGSLQEDELAAFRQRARGVVARLDERRPWVLKDPRLCLLLPLWRPVLDEPAFVLAWRNPLEVARSLRARDGLPLAVGIAVWEVYNQAALRHSLGAPRVLISYADLMRDARATAERIAAWAADASGGSVLRVPDDAALAAMVVDPLYRQRSPPEEALAHLNPAQEALRTALADGSALGWNTVPAPSAAALDLLRSFAAVERRRSAATRRSEELAARATTAEGETIWRRERDAEISRYNDSLREHLDARETEIAHLREHRDARETELAYLRERDAEMSRYTDSLREHLDAREAEAAVLREELARRDADLEGLRRRDAEISQHNETLAASLAVESARHDKALAELERRQAQVAGLLRASSRLAERAIEHAAGIERLLAEVLRSRRWRAGRWLATLLRRYAPQTSAETRHSRLHLDLESLADEQRDLAAEVGRWSADEPS